MSVCCCSEAALATHFRQPGFFKSDEEEGTELSKGYGTFHQLYRIDGHLMAGVWGADCAWGLGPGQVYCRIAVFPNGELPSLRSFTRSHYMHGCNLNRCDVTVSIVDILPGRFVSAYSFYNPDYRHMEWGRYTALREIFWTQQVCWPVHACRWLASDAQCTVNSMATWAVVIELQLLPLRPVSSRPWIWQAMRHSPFLRHYDMCTYVHGCPRMNYKREYKPSEIMCPALTRGQWVDLDASAPLLDADKCVVVGILIVGYKPHVC